MRFNNKIAPTYFAVRYLFAMLTASALLTGCSGGSNSEADQPQVVETPVVDPIEVPEVVEIEHPPAILDVNFECDETLSTGLSPEMLAAIDLAEIRFGDVLTSTENSDEKYIDYTSTSGHWELQTASRWTSGFLPGIYWYLYALTNDSMWLSVAEESTRGLISRATATDNDTGFQIVGSYGVGKDILGGNWPEADIAIEDGAETLLSERYNPDVGAFRAWPQRVDDPFEISSSSPFEVNVDMIMNMEILLAAAEQTFDSSMYDTAVSHADITWENLIRPDFSSFHVAAFNGGGVLSYTRTHQGWLAGSTWSRGQAWAVYGYTMMYRYTTLDRMLERAQKSYQYFKTATLEQSENWVPYADFNAPIDIRNPRDTSATAIVAAAAIELYEHTGNTLYLSDAKAMIEILINNFLSTDTAFESLLLAGSEQYVREDDDASPNSAGYEVGASFGDFYFLEALFRLEKASSPNCL